MTAIVFAGPTISARDIRGHLRATIYPPVAQGDIYRILRAGPKPVAIGLIDGYFGSVQAVWHKEILWAMSQGVYVFGSASLGALRAAEMATFGMVGVGEIFRMFFQNELEDDDEVALVHGPKETGYRALSEPMVNIRATVKSAIGEGVIDHDTANVIIQFAKTLHYENRRYEAIMSSIGSSGVPDSEIAKFMSWLPSGRVNQKYVDAAGMLQAMRMLLQIKPKPFVPKFSFEHTDAWETFCIRMRREQSDVPTSAALSDVALVEEVQLRDGFARVRDGTLVRVLAKEREARSMTKEDKSIYRRALAELRIDLGLKNVGRYRRWLKKQSLTNEGDISEFVWTEALVRQTRTSCASAVSNNIAEYLRSTGEYGDIAARAADKKRTLARLYLDEPSVGDVGMTEMELWKWYFEETQGLSVPENLASAAASRGFPDYGAFLLAVLREYCYLRETGRAAKERKLRVRTKKRSYA